MRFNLKVFIITFVILFTTLFSCGDSNNKNRIEASGIIETIEITISSRISGELKRLNYDEGDFVKKNDTIAEVDRSNLIIQKKQYQAGSLLAEAQLKMVINGSREEDIRQSEESLKIAKTNFELTELDKTRSEDLFKSKSISQKQWDDISAKYKVSLAQYKSAEEFYKKIKKGSRIEDIESAQAKKIQADAQCEFIDKQISDSYIVSPADGVLSHKVFEVGELIMVGSSLFKISKMDKVHLMVYINEIDLGRVKLGQNAEVKIDSYPDKIMNGKVIYISSSAEFTPKNIQSKEDRTKLVFGVKIEIENPENILKPGLPADASIITN